MRKNLLIDLNKLDETIAKLEQIKQLLEEINRLKKDPAPYPDPYPRPEPTPWIPVPGTTTADPPWKSPYTVWCQSKDDNNVIL